VPEREIAPREEGRPSASSRSRGVNDLVRKAIEADSTSNVRIVKPAPPAPEKPKLSKEEQAAADARWKKHQMLMEAQMGSDDAMRRLFESRKNLIQAELDAHRSHPRVAGVTADAVLARLHSSWRLTANESSTLEEFDGKIRGQIETFVANLKAGKISKI
jgi:hypothetical protein